MPASRILLVALLVLACGKAGNEGLRSDAGQGVDAGQAADAGQVSDAGHASDAGQNPDAGQGVDAGQDAGNPDAGQTAGVLDPARSSLTVTFDAPPLADGNSAAVVTIRLVDLDAQPMAGVQVDIAVTGSGNTLASPQVTDSTGTLVATLTSTRAETKQVSAVASTPSGLTALSQEGTVTFVSGPDDHLAFVSAPATGTAGAPLGLAVAVEDANGNLTSTPRAVTLSLLGGGVLVTTPVGTLTQDAVGGIAHFDDVGMTIASTFWFIASSDGLPDVISPPVEIFAAAPSAVTSSVTLVNGGTAQTVSDGSTGITLRVTALDGYGNPCNGRPVSLTATGDQNVFAPASGATNYNGQFQTVFSSRKAEKKSVAASVQGVQIGTFDATFQAGPPDPQHSSITVTPSTIVADGTSTAQVEISFRDQFDNPSAEDFVLTGDGVATFGLYMSPYGEVWSKVWNMGTADIVLPVRSTRAGPLTITTPPSASGGITLSTTMTFLPGPTTQLLVTPSFSRAYSGERLPSLVVEHADAFGNVIPDGTGNVTAFFQSNPTSAVLSGTTTQPFVNGVATFDDLSLDRAGKGFQLGFTDGTYSGATSAFDEDAFQLTGPWGGDILAIASGAKIWVGTRGGGLFQSADRGVTWSAAADEIPDRTIETIDAVPGSNRAVFVGTPSGSYRSLDDGATWQALPPQGLEFRAIAANPTSLPVVVAATPAGLYTSSVNASSFTYSDGGVTDPDVRSVAGGYRYLAGTGGGRVFLSGDGTAWKDVGVDFGAPVTAVSVAPYGSTIALFAGTDGNGIFRSVDYGGTWNPIISPSANVVALSNPGFPPLLALTRDDGLFRSSDNGVSWQASSTGLPSATLNGVLIASRSLLATSAGVYLSTDGYNSWTPSSVGIANVAANRLVADPAGGWLVATGSEGVERSSDTGRSWTASDQGLTASAVTGLGYSPDGGVLYAATNEGVFRSADDGTLWSSASSGLAATDLTDLAVASDGTVFVASASGGVFASADEAGNWNAANNGLASLNVRELVPGEGVLYAATGAGVDRSVDDAASWTDASAGLTSLDVTALALGPSGDLVAGTADGQLFVSGDGAGSWSALTPVSGSAQAIAFDPFVSGELYVGSSSGLWSSVDSGGTWTDLSAGMRSKDVLSIAADATTPGLLLVGTRGVGVLRASDRGR